MINWYYTLDAITGGECDAKSQAVERMTISQNVIEVQVNSPVNSIYSAWSTVLNESKTGEGMFLQNLATGGLTVPRPPHLENCKLANEANRLLDKRMGNGELPPWTMWTGFLHNYPLSTKDEEQGYNGHQVNSKGVYPPWVRVTYNNYVIFAVG